MPEIPSSNSGEFISTPEENQAELEQETFDISNFLVEPKNDYSDLIKETEKNSQLDDWGTTELFTSYASDLERVLRGKIGSNENMKKEWQEAFNYFKEKLKGKILINLGAGAYGAMSNFAKELGVKTYIEVDKFFPENKEITENPLVDLSLGEKIGDMQIVKIKSDMLDFLARLPDKSVSIVINGIDGELIKNEEYHAALVKEFSRVVPQENIVFGRNSSSLNLMHKEDSSKIFKPFKLELLSGKYAIGADIFEKK